MQSVEKMYESLAALEGGSVVVHPQRCVLVRNRNAECLQCAEVCTSGAISIANDSICVDEEKCVDCGTCATACPTCALEVREEDDHRLFDEVRRALKRQGGCAQIACQEAHALSGPVGVKCLGRVDESLLVSALAMPGAREISLVHGACERCAHKTGFDVAQRVVESSNALLSSWGVYPRVRFEAAEAACGDAAPLEPVGKHAPSTFDGSRAYAKVGRDGTLPQYAPARRKRLVGALSALGPAPDTLVETRLWGHVSIDDDACVSCRMCTTFCPAGAISKWDADGAFGLVHEPRLCVKCRCCESICPVGAITISEGVHARHLVDGTVDRIPLREPDFQRGSGNATKGIMGSLLGEECVFDR